MKYCANCLEPIGETDRVCPHCQKQFPNDIPPHHLPPGTVLNDRYYLGRTLGEGGFGITYFGLDMRLQIKVAVKEFFPCGFVTRAAAHSSEVQFVGTEGAAWYEKGKADVLREARVLASFSGEKGIVGVRDFFEANHTAYIVMDYLQGITMGSLLQARGCLAPGYVLNLMLPVMNALNKVHKQGVVHRDISPDNLMIYNGTATLMDFGSARRIAEANRTYSVQYKPGYAPAEQYSSKAALGPWTDVYALCATIYRCITGIIPPDSLERLSEDTLKPISQVRQDLKISPQIDRALMKGMALDVKERFQDIDELLAALTDTKANAQNPQPQPQRQSAVQPKTVAVQQFAVQEGTPQIPQPTQMTQAAPGLPVQPAPQPEPKKKFPVRAAVMACACGAAFIAAVGSITYFATHRSADPADSSSVSSVDPANSDTPRSTAAPSGNSSGGNAGYTKVKPKKIKMLSDSQSAEICGKDYKAGDTTMVSIYKAEITAADIEAMASLPHLESVYITQTPLSTELLAETAAYLGSVKRISFDTCPGITNLAPLAEMTGLTRLVLTGGTADTADLNAVDFSALTNLDVLDVSDNTALSDLSFAPRIANLRELDVSGCAVKDISPLANCPMLSLLNISTNQISDLSGLPQAALYTLQADNNSITDISVLGNMPALRYLYLSNNQISDLSPLSADAELKTLEIAGNQITDLSGLGTCTRLQELNISDNQITSLAPLSAASALTKIVASGNQLTSLKGLESHLHLKTLNAANNQLTDTAGLENCTILERVQLNNNRIRDFSILKKSVQTLTCLDIADNQADSLAFVSGMAQLKILRFDNNQITDLSPIAGCTKMELLSGENNHLPSISALSGMTGIRAILLSHNEIASMEGLPASSKYMMLDLSHNNIREIKMSQDLNISYASFYANPLSAANLPQLCRFKGSSMWFSFADGADLSKMKSRYINFTVVNCPPDKQVSVEQQLGRFSLTFYTEQEADQIVAEKKASIVSEYLM